MSTANHEALYATCHDEAWEEYQRVYKLKDNEMLGEYVLDAIDTLAWKRYQDRLI
tara:strand:+ start:365 stop:529 length:165 start_codon:yes stop_codon:yes gene_type:complete